MQGAIHAQTIPVDKRLTYGGHTMYTVKSVDYAGRIRALLADGRFAYIESTAKTYDTFEDAKKALEYFKTVWSEPHGIYHDGKLIG